MNIASNVRAEATQGLHQSEQFYFRFWKKTALRTEAAERALDRVEQSGDASAIHAATVARTAAAATADPRRRLQALRQGLRLVEAGAASGICGMASMGIDVLATVEAGAAKPLLDRVGQTATAENAPEAGFAAYLGDLSNAGASARDALARLARPAATDAAGYATAVLDLSNAPATRKAAIEDIRKLPNDPATQAHLARRDALTAVQLDGNTQAILDRAILSAVAKSAPATAEANAAFMADLVKSASLPADRATLAGVALADAERAAWPADSAVPAWLALARQAEAAVGAQEALRTGVLRAVTGKQPLTLAAAAHVFEAVAGAQKPDAAGVAVAQALFDQLEPIDPQHAADTCKTIRGLLADVGTTPAARLAILTEGIHVLTDPKTPAEASLPGLAQRLAGNSPDAATVYRLADVFLGRIAASGSPVTIALASAAHDAMALRFADDKQTVAFFSETMKQLQKPPADLAGAAAAGSRMINTVGYNMDRLHIARALMPGLHTVAAGGANPVASAQVDLLQRLAGRDLYDPGTQTSAITSGLQYLAKPPKVSADEVAHFAATVAPTLKVYVDYLHFSEDVLAALKARAQGKGDASMEDAVDLIARVAKLDATDDQYRQQPVAAGLNYLASQPNGRGDAYLALGNKLMSASNSPHQQCGIAEAVADGLQVRAQRSREFYREGQAAFVKRIAGLAMASQAQRLQILARGLDAAANGKGTQEDGLARVALAMLGGAGYAHDQVQIAQAALAEAIRMTEQAGDGDRLEILRAFDGALAVPNYEDKYRAAVAQIALQWTSQRLTAEPGELASVGLQMVDQSYYFVNMLDVGAAVLSGLEALAAREHDKVFVPALVDDVRHKMQSAGSPKAQLDALRTGLKEISRLKGDAFRKALVAALQKEQPGDAPKIEEGEEFVIINGIKVPRSKEE